METFENKTPATDSRFETIEPEVSGIKKKLGNIGRRIKRIDLRSTIADHPFAAVGVAAGVGALIGLARPMPQRGRVSGAMMALLSTIGFRIVREAAMVQLGHYAKGLLSKDEPGMQANVPQAGQPTY
ncbi:MAG TPA: hypothetical protein VIV11_23365 [Kofleriaceae bacterium]